MEAPLLAVAIWSAFAPTLQHGLASECQAQDNSDCGEDRSRLDVSVCSFGSFLIRSVKATAKHVVFAVPDAHAGEVRQDPLH